MLYDAFVYIDCCFLPFRETVNLHDFSCREIFSYRKSFQFKISPLPCRVLGHNFYLESLIQSKLLHNYFSPCYLVTSKWSEKGKKGVKITINDFFNIITKIKWKIEWFVM